MEMKSSDKPNVELQVECKWNPCNFSLYISNSGNGARERRGTVAVTYGGSLV